MMQNLRAPGALASSWGWTRWVIERVSLHFHVVYLCTVLFLWQTTIFYWTYSFDFYNNNLFYCNNCLYLTLMSYKCSRHQTSVSVKYWSLSISIYWWSVVGNSNTALFVHVLRDTFSFIYAFKCPVKYKSFRDCFEISFVSVYWIRLHQLSTS